MSKNTLFSNISRQTLFLEEEPTFINKKKKISTTTTIYVGNLSYHTREETIWNLFFKLGKVKRIIMGLNRFNLTPCGFCFLEFFEFVDTQKCIFYLEGYELDNRKIKIDLDGGFSDGRQFGRGKRGGPKQEEKIQKKKNF